MKPGEAGESAYEMKSKYNVFYATLTENCKILVTHANVLQTKSPKGAPQSLMYFSKLSLQPQYFISHVLKITISRNTTKFKKIIENLRSKWSQAMTENFIPQQIDCCMKGTKKEFRFFSISYLNRNILYVRK